MNTSTGIQVCFANFKMTVNVASSFGREQNNFLSESKLYDTTVRHIIEISDDDVMTILTLKISSIFFFACAYGAIMHEGNVEKIQEKTLKHEA